MADTTFVDDQTKIMADWLNDLNRLHYSILGDPAGLVETQSALGIIPKTLTEISGNHVIPDTDEGGVIVVDTSGGNVQVELPTIDALKQFTIKKITTDGNTVTIIPDSGGSSTIDGAANAVLPGSVLNSITLFGTTSHGWVII